MTSRLLQKPTFPASIVKSRLCVSGTSLIPSASTEKRKERARGLKVYPSTLRYAFFFATVFQETILFFPDRYDSSVFHTLWDCEWGQPYQGKPKTNIGGRVGGRCRGKTLREKEIRGATICQRGERQKYFTRQKGDAKGKVVILVAFVHFKTFWLAHADYFESFGKTKMRFAGLYER